MSISLLHDIPYGSHAPESINTIIEIPKGSKNKYEIDKKTGLIMLDRAMHSAQDYPFDYGFMPQSLWDDGDPLDVVVLTTYPLAIGVLVRVRPVGVLRMIDDGESDAKIIGVPEHDPRFDEIHDITDVNKHTLKEIEHFFNTYKKINHKDVHTNGYGDKKEAQEAVMRSIEQYKNKHK
jgi:inorganic pyrophosphatase